MILSIDSDKYGRLPLKVTREYKPSQWYRITATEFAPNHKGLNFWSPRFKCLVKQIAVDFGTASSIYKGIYSNRNLKITASSKDKGNYLIAEWQGKQSGAWYEMLLVHVNNHPKIGTIIPAGQAFCSVADKANNGGFTPHTHIAFARNGLAIHYSQILNGK